MNKKMVYSLALIAFVALWGVLGMAASPVQAQPAMQETIVPPVDATPIISTVVVPGATQLVPVTGGDDGAGTNLMMLLFYGFLGLLAIVLLVALFASANRTAYVRRDGPPPPPDDL